MEEAARLAVEATGADCPDAARAAARRIESLRDLIAAIGDADMVAELRGVEADLVHAKAFGNSYPLPRRLATAVALIRTHAGPALHDLAGEIDRASRRDIDDPAAVKEAISALNAAVAASANVAACQEALRVIGDYELDEE